MLSGALTPATTTSGSEARAAWLERLRIRPAEAYGVWRHYCGEKFLRDFLTGTTATEEERERLLWFTSRVVRYQGRPRLASKTQDPRDFCRSMTIS